MLVALSENLSQATPEEHSQWQRDRDKGDLLEQLALETRLPKAGGHCMLTWLTPSLKAPELMKSVA